MGIYLTLTLTPTLSLSLSLGLTRSEELGTNQVKNVHKETIVNCAFCLCGCDCVCVCVFVRPGYNQGINKSQFLFATFHVVTERYEIHSSKFVARAISNDFITIDRAYGGADRQQTTKLTGNNNNKNSNKMRNKLKNFLLSISLYSFFSWKIYSPLIWLFSYA